MTLHECIQHDMAVQEEEVETEKRPRISSSSDVPSPNTSNTQQAPHVLSPREADNAFLRGRIQELIDQSYHFCVPADLRPLFTPYSGKMRGFDLSDLNFTLASMCYIDFTGVDFTGSNFLHSNLTGCILRDTNFSRTVLSHANFTDTEMDRTLFAFATFHKTILATMPVRTAFKDAIGMEWPLHLEYIRDSHFIQTNYA